MHELDLYQSNALQTAVYPLERALDYTVLGLLSEVGELEEVYYNANTSVGAGRVWSLAHMSEAKSELGDLYWYTASIADALGTTLGQITTTAQRSTVVLLQSRGLTLSALTVEAGAIAGILKKAIRDEGGTLSCERRGLIEHHLLRVLALLDHFAVLLGTTGTRVRQANILKLADRKERGVIGGSGNAR